MKRPILLVGLLLSLGVVVPGCPVYNEEGCNEDAHCAPGYVCELLTGECVEPAPLCERPSDCSSGSTCDREGRCRSVDCSWEDVGCVRGYTCVRDDGVWRCVAGSSGGGSPGAGGEPGQVGGASQGGTSPSPGGASQGGASPAEGGQPGTLGGAPSGGFGGEPTTGGAPGAAGEPSIGGAPATGGAPAASGQGGG